MLAILRIKSGITPLPPRTRYPAAANLTGTGFPPARQRDLARPRPHLFVRVAAIELISSVGLASTMFKIIKNSCGWLSRKLNFIAYLTAENLALRQRLIVLKRKHNRPKLKERDRLFWVVMSRIWPGWRDTLLIVQPDTVVRWHKRAFKSYWRRRSE